MISEYAIDAENVCLAVIPLETTPVVTQVAEPATFSEHPAIFPSPAECCGEETRCAMINGGMNDGGMNDCGASGLSASQSPTTEGFESLIELVMDAANSVRELMTPCFTAHGLNDARFTIMRAIRGSRNAECSQSELARCLKQSEANVSTLLDRMRGDGLVSREKSPFDRRRSVVRLTDKGQQQLTLTEQDYLTRARGVLRAFDVFEIESFRTQLTNFVAIWETELEQSGSNNAVAGRIGESTNDSHPEGSETRHAQAG